MIQSASEIFSKSSSKFPVLILVANDLEYKDAGLDLIAALSALLTIEFLSLGSDF